MTDWKKVLVSIALLVVIVVAAVFIVRHFTGRSTEMPAELKREAAGRSVEKIDQKTLEVMTKTLGEWEKLGSKGEKYKNPKTGTYTMVPVLVCASCGEKIPLPDFPPNAGFAERQKIASGYICPRCGKKAYAR